MMDTELTECVKNPLVRAFLLEHLDEFAVDVLIFSEQILAHVPSESKPFIKSAGLAFYSTPIVSFVPDLPWQTMKTRMANAISEVFHIQSSHHGYHKNQIPGALDKDHTETEFIKQAIVAAFESICTTAEDTMGAILIGGLAHLLGKYIALYIAGMIDEIIQHKSWPIVPVPSTGSFQKRSSD